MAVDDNFCKVTVHRASPPLKEQAAMPRGRRQTIATESESAAFFFPRQQRAVAAAAPARATERHAKALTEIIPDEEFDAMLQSADQTRRRAKTDAAGTSARGSSRRRNPLSRLTLRWTEQRESAKLSSAAAASSYDDDYDSSNNTTDMLDDLLDDDDDEPPLLDLRADGEFNNSFLDCDTNESDPLMRQTMDDVFAAGTPPIPAGLTLDMLPTAFTDPSLSRSFTRNLFSSSVGPNPFQSQAAAAAAAPPSDTDDDETSSVATSSMLDYESDEEVNIDEMRGKAEAIARFEASFHDRPTPLFRTTEIPKSRPNRGMSSPVRMLSQVIRTRKQSNPVHPRTHDSTASDDLNLARSALYSGQSLHLNFKSSRGHIVQVSGQPKKSASKNIFSKRIRCQKVDEALPLDIRDALRIIGHTTDGIIHGGDCISIARNDGHVLRLQKLSRKLCFSAKIDLRAKFIVTGVPEGTVVTSKTKFYLQSVYDRSKTVGFLNSRRSSSPGCLVMYVYRNKEDKSEPIQFYQRPEPEIAEIAPTRQQQQQTQHHHQRQQQQQQQQPESSPTREEDALQQQEQQQFSPDILTPITLVVD